MSIVILTSAASTANGWSHMRDTFTGAGGDDLATTMMGHRQARPLCRANRASTGRRSAATMLDDRVALTAAQVLRMGLVTRSQLDWWHKTELVDSDNHEPGRLRFYSLAQAVELGVVGTLRARGVSLQEIRKMVNHLRREGHQRPLREITWATESGRLYFQLPDGSWFESRRPSQAVIHKVLRLEEIEQRVKVSLRRPEEASGQTEKRRGALKSKTLVAGTRIPVASVRKWLDSGATEERVLRAYPALTRKDLAAVRAS